MPYIKKERREELEYAGIDGQEPTLNAGDLNYMLTTLCWEYYQLNGGKYQQINDVLGALEGAKLEFYRRVAAPYEDKKIEENGDVYV